MDLKQDCQCFKSVSNLTANDQITLEKKTVNFYKFFNAKEFAIFLKLYLRVRLPACDKQLFGG